MKVKELIDLLLDCDKDLDVVNADYDDVIVVKEESVHGVRDGVKATTKHVIIEF